jgi:NADPH-dependent ferric siderophore reductase
MPTITPEGRVWPQGEPRPAVRTYTPRAFDPETGTLEIVFVLHESGPASDWARRVTVGDHIAVAGPGGRFSHDLSHPHWWIAGDESALPAIGTLLEALPAGVHADVHVEVDGPDDEIALSSAADTEVTWHQRRGPGMFGAELHDAVVAAEMPDDVQVWVACEATAVRRIRRHLLTERPGSASSLITRGYWRIGAADHPDHDYGED